MNRKASSILQQQFVQIIHHLGQSTETTERFRINMVMIMPVRFWWYATFNGVPIIF